MNEQEALSRMLAPGTPKPNKWRNGIIQVHITRACDRACYACTQGSNLGGKPIMITPENFEVAVKSLSGYFGVVGIFGGNPALHPQFPLLCEILTKHIAYEHRGLWCNHPMGHGKLMSKVFNPAVSNLNVHQSQEAYDEFKRDWPTSRPFGLESDSRHAPVFASMVDMEVPTEKRWELISDCDINHHWSALVGQFRGKPRAWFCEIAGAQSMLQQDLKCKVCNGSGEQKELPDSDNAMIFGRYDTRPCDACFDGYVYPDTGLDPGQLYDGKLWWQLPMQSYVHQVRQHCHHCAVPLRGYGQLANLEGQHEQTTRTYLPIFKPKRQRPVDLITSPEELGEPLQLATDYIGNGKK